MADYKWVAMAIPAPNIIFTEIVHCHTMHVHCMMYDLITTQCMACITMYLNHLPYSNVLMI